MYLPFKIALRYFLSRKNQNHFGFLTLLSVLGVFISVGGFLVVDGVLNGFGLSIQRALIGFDSNLIVTLKPGDHQETLTNIIKENPDVAFYQPVLEFEALVYSQERLLGALKIRGIPPDNFDLQPRVKFYGFDAIGPENNDRFFIGEEFFTRSLLSPELKNNLTVVNPFGDIGPSGEFVPLSTQRTVSGFFSTGHYDFDAQYAYLPLSAAQKICGITCSSQMLIFYKEGLLDSSLEAQLKELGYFVSTWRDINKSRYMALKLERLGLFFLLTLVLLIASVNIFSLISLISFKKLKENVLFWVLGLNKSKVRLVYVFYSFLLGLAGTLPGLVLAFSVLAYLKYHPQPLPPAYYLESLPVEISIVKLMLLLFLAPFLSVVTGLWPAMKTTRHLPLEVLRNS